MIRTFKNLSASSEAVKTDCNSDFMRHIIDKTVNSTINTFFQFNRQNGNNSPECFHVKLPYVGKFSAIAQKRIRRSIQRFCDNSLDIKLVFSSFKIGSL